MKVNISICQTAITLCLMISCANDDASAISLDITTTDISEVTLSSIVSGGNIITDQPETITSRGVCWGKFPLPKLSGSTGRTEDGNGGGSFSSELKPLGGGTYHIRSYAKIAEQIFYGNEIVFNMDTLIPSILIETKPNVESQTIEVKAKISYSWKDPILEKGLCWGFTPNPNIIQNSKILGSGHSKEFSGNISSVSLLTTIYIRAYVITKHGTFYSEQKNELLFPPIENGQIMDIDGNVYKTVKIGSQTWLASNLKVTKFNDGTSITFASTQNEFKITKSEAYTYLHNDANKPALYGFLYNGYVNNSNKNVCMDGWHIATYSDWAELASLLGGFDVAGDRMKSVSDLWFTKQVATNQSGFSGLPGGSYCSICLSGSGIFADEGTDGYWWSAQAKDFFYLTNDLSSLRTKNTSNINDGLSIRCVKN